MDEMQHKQKHKIVPLINITMQSHLRSCVQYPSPQFKRQASAMLHVASRNPRIFKLKEGQEPAFIFADLTTQASPCHKSKSTAHLTNTSRMLTVVKTNDEKPCKEH